MAYQVSTSNEQIKHLEALVNQLLEAEERVSDAEQRLADAEKVKRKIEEEDIPELMDSLGMEEFKAPSGFQVKVRRSIKASIGSRKRAAFEWLQSHGHGALIKRSIEAQFGRQDSQDAEQLLQELRDRFDDATVRQHMKVEPSTLSAWVREQLESGEDIPLDVFGVHERRVAQVKQGDRNE